MLALAAIAVVGLVLPAQAQMGRGGMRGGAAGARGGGSIVPEGAKQLPPERRSDHNSEGYGEELRLAGRCDKAEPIFRRIVNSPWGYPITKYNLGLCLLDLAAANGDATKAAQQRHEGAEWILRAANAGFNLAQAKAVALYLDGVGVAADPVEADKWALIYHDNGTRLALGLPDIASDLRDRLDSTLTDAQRAQAQAQADAWVRPVQPLDR